MCGDCSTRHLCFSWTTSRVTIFYAEHVFIRRNHKARVRKLILWRKDSQLFASIVVFTITVSNVCYTFLSQYVSTCTVSMLSRIKIAQSSNIFVKKERKSRIAAHRVHSRLRCRLPWVLDLGVRSPQKCSKEGKSCFCSDAKWKSSSLMSNTAAATEP